MLTERFNTLFTGLAAAFIRYDNTPRTAESVILLARARADLEDARYAIRLERRHMLQALSPKPQLADATRVSPVFSLNHER